MIFAKHIDRSDNASDQTTRRKTLDFFGMGLLTNSLNPKTSLFVISLYSQIIVSGTVLSEKLVWGAFIALSHLLWFASVSVFMSTPHVRNRILANQRIVNLAIGTVLLALACLLMVNDDMGGVLRAQGNSVR